MFTIVRLRNWEGHGMRENKKVKQRKLLSGFSYLEVVIALIIASTSTLGLMQISLQQTDNSSKLSALLQSQLLQLDIQNRLKVNKEYILEQQNKALYFIEAQSLFCDQLMADKCYLSSCSDQQLAELDVLELSCKAKGAGLTHRMELQTSSQMEGGSEVVVSIWLTPELCRSDECKLAEHRLWL